MRRTIAAAAVLVGGLLGSSLWTSRAGAQNGTVAVHGGDGGQAGRELLARRVSVSLRRVSVKAAIDSVARTSGILIQYRLPMLASYTTPVTVNATDMAVGVVLERVLDGTALRAIPDGRGNLAIVSDVIDADSVPSGGVVSGRVVDSATGRGLPGATIAVAGKKISVVAGDSGRFTLRNVPVGEQALTVRLFGYRAEQRAVTITGGDAVALRVVMKPTANVLRGVVTTAVGVQDRRTVGNDITVLNADSIMRTAPIKNLTDLLDGRVPGLMVQHTSGVAGAPSRIRLRGVTSGLVASGDRSNDPILIVDGIRVYSSTSTRRDQNLAASSYTAPSGFDQIDPNSIETVEVYKGPSASSLYGPDAANGVIVVTTKRGQVGKTRLRAEAGYGINYMPGAYAAPGWYGFGHLLVGGPSRPCQGLGIDGFAGAVSSSSCIRDSLVSFQALSVPRLSLFGTGTDQSGTLTASGGSGTLTYNLTGSAKNSLGYVKMPAFYRDQYEEAYQRPIPDWMKRPIKYAALTGTGTLESTPYAGLRLTFVSTLGTDRQQQSSAQTNIAALSGIYIDTTVLQRATLGQYTTRVTSHSLMSNNSLTASWNRWTWIPLQGVVGVSRRESEDESLVPYGFWGANDTLGDYTYGQRITTEQTLTMTGTLFPQGRVRTGIGLNVFKQTPQDMIAVADSLQPGVASAAAFTSVTRQTSSLTTAGWFIEPRLHISDRLFLAPGFRLDNKGSYRTGGGLAALLPKMDFSWTAVDREGQTPMLGVLTLLRPRVAFGVSGTQPDPTQLLRTYALGTFQQDALGNISGCNQNFNDGLCYEGVRLTAVGNPDLHPERTREVELGFDAELWENRVTLTVSHDTKITKDAIVQTPIAPSAGSRSLLMFQNIGDVQDVTTEMSLTLVPVQTAATSWSITANLTTLRNTVRRLNDLSGSVDFGNGTRAVVGYPLNGRWARPIVGYVAPGSGQRFWTDNVFVADSAVYVGSALPKYQLPVSSSISLWRGLVSVSAAVNYEHGFTQFGSGDMQRLVNTYLDPTSTPGQLAAVVAGFCYNQDISGSCFRSTGTPYGLIETVNVLRLNSLSINYNVPTHTTARFGLPRMSVSLQGSNLGLWTGYRGKDPDVNGTPVGESIKDDGQVPLPRTWGLTISLGD